MDAVGSGDSNLRTFGEYSRGKEFPRLIKHQVYARMSFLHFCCSPGEAVFAFILIYIISRCFIYFTNRDLLLSVDLNFSLNCIFVPVFLLSTEILEENAISPKYQLLASCI